MPDVQSSAYPTGGLSGLIDAYNSGVDTRLRRAKEVADSQQKQDEFLAQHAPYYKGNHDPNGFASGLSPDEEGAMATKARAYFGLDKDTSGLPTAPGQAPSPFVPAPQPAAPPPPASDSDTPEARAARNADRDRLMGLSPGRAPDSSGKAEIAPGDPRPLVRHPDASLADQLVPRPGMPAAQAPAVSNPQKPITGPGGEKVILPEGATSMEYDPTDKPVTQGGKTFVPARKTDVPAASGDAEVLPPGTPGQLPAAQAPAQAPAQAQPGGGKLVPDAYSLKRLVDLDTTMPRAAAGYPVDVNNLPPQVAEALGVTDEMRAAHVKIPQQIVDTVLRGNSALAVQGLKNEGQSFDPKFQPVLDALQNKEVTLGGAVSMASRLNNGQRPPPALLRAMQQATSAGNSDRNYNFGLTKFDQGQRDQVARESGKYASKALAETKTDLESIQAFNTVAHMLDRKDTNGLRNFVPIMIERGFIPQKLSNYMVQSDKGLIDFGSRLEQAIQSLDTGELTPDNIGFFKSMVNEGLKEKRGEYALKTQRWKRAGVGALMAKGLDGDQAMQIMERELSPDAQSVRMGNDDEEAGGQGEPTAADLGAEPPSRPAPAPKGPGAKQVYPGVNVRTSNAPDLGTDAGRAKMLAFKNQAIRIKMNDPSLNDQQRKAAVAAIQKQFEADMAAGLKKQGIKKDSR